MGTKGSGGSCQSVIILSALTVNGFFHFVNRVQTLDSFQKLVSVLCKKARLRVIGKNNTFCGSNLAIFNPNLYDIRSLFLKMDAFLGGSEINSVYQTALFFFCLRLFRLCLFFRHLRFCLILGFLHLTAGAFLYILRFLVVCLGLALRLFGRKCRGNGASYCGLASCGSTSTGTASIRGTARSGGECSADTGNALAAFCAGKSFSGFIHYLAIGKVASVFVYRVSILG